jgi:hypothetical protein
MHKVIPLTLGLIILASGVAYAQTGQQGTYTQTNQSGNGSASVSVSVSVSNNNNTKAQDGNAWMNNGQK